MQITTIKAEDLVLVDKRGTRFHARVDGKADGVLMITPLQRNISYRTARPREVKQHWSLRGRPRTANESASMAA
jgi:hypothetical protein